MLCIQGISRFIKTPALQRGTRLPLCHVCKHANDTPRQGRFCVLGGKWQGALLRKAPEASATATKTQSAAKPVPRWRFVGLVCVDAKTGIPGEEPACGTNSDDISKTCQTPVTGMPSEPRTFSMHTCDGVRLLHFTELVGPPQFPKARFIRKFHYRNDLWRAPESARTLGVVSWCLIGVLSIVCRWPARGLWLFVFGSPSRWAALDSWGQARILPPTENPKLEPCL